jgi:hypothetical protein
MKTKAFPLCAAALSFVACIVTAEPPRDAEYRGAVKELKPLPSVLGDQWVSAFGLVIEDLNDAESHPVGERAAVQALKAQLEPVGVRKAADFSFRVPDDPSQFVTLRVFVFDAPESCAKWWDKKYRHDGWEKFYKPVEGVEYLAVDSTESPKRAVAIGNVWMTCHSLKNPRDHLEIMNACVEKLVAAMKPK